MKTLRTILLLAAVLLCLGACGRGKTAAEGTVRATDTIRYARNLHIAYYDDYVSVRIRDPWDTLRQRQHYVLVDRDKPLPARLPAELIANGALARFFSTETVTFDPASRRLVARPK